MAKQQTQTATRQAPPQQQGQQQPPWPDQKPAQPIATTNGAPQAGEREVEYTPLGESQKIKLTINMVRTLLCTPTKSGHLPPDNEVIKFMMICRQRALNPWVGDAYLLGYETQRWGDKWSIVVAIQALLKRAEINQHFDGIESGVVVENANHEITERQGDLVYDGETLIGGWAKVYRKDRGRPFYQRLKLGTYSRNTPIWDSDPAGMICKDAEAAALRQAFPSEVGSLYLEGELLAMMGSDDPARGGNSETAAPAKPASAKDQLQSRLSTVVGKAPAKPPEGTQTRQEAPGEHDQTQGGQEGDEPVQGQPVATGGDEGAFGGQDHHGDSEDSVPAGHDGPGVQF
jgi:phage recombination protein Bet